MVGDTNDESGGDQRDYDAGGGDDQHSGDLARQKRAPVRHGHERDAELSAAVLACGGVGGYHEEGVHGGEHDRAEGGDRRRFSLTGVGVEADR